MGDTQSIPDIGADYIARRRQHLVGEEIEGEIIVYDEQRETAHLLNPTAAIVWQLLDGATRLGDVAIELAAAFERSTDEILRDVIQLVKDFASQGLLEISAAGTPAAG